MKLSELLKKHADGSYEPTKQITISRPDGNIITIGPGLKFMPGVQMLGVDIEQLLQLEVKEPGDNKEDNTNQTSPSDEKPITPEEQK